MYVLTLIITVASMANTCSNNILIIVNIILFNGPLSRIRNNGKRYYYVTATAYTHSIPSPPLSTVYVIKYYIYCALYLCTFIYI